MDVSVSEGSGASPHKISEINVRKKVYVFNLRSLRDSYNILIAAICISGFFYLFTYSIQFGIAVTGINLIYLKNCYFLMILPIFFVQSQYLLYLALSIDRLIVVILPLW